MSWIKVNLSLRNSPKLNRLALRLGVTHSQALGGACVAWMLADANADARGKIALGTPEWLDREAELPGLALAMTEIGWLVIGDDHLQFVDYQEHNGTTARTRAQTQRRMANKRVRDASRVRHAGVTRGEERREEESRKEDPPPLPGGGAGESLREDAGDPDGFDRSLAATAERLGRLYPKIFGQSETIRAAARALGRTATADWPAIEAGLRRYREAFRSWPEAVRSRTLNGSRWFDDGHWDDDPATWSAPRPDPPVRPSNGAPPPSFPPDPETADAEMRL